MLKSEFKAKCTSKCMISHEISSILSVSSSSLPASDQKGASMATMKGHIQNCCRSQLSHRKAACNASTMLEALHGCEVEQTQSQEAQKHKRFPGLESKIFLQS